MTKLSGFCIGGPLAGQEVSRPEPYFRTMVQKPLPTVFSYGKLDIGLSVGEIDFAVYYHTKTSFGGFWVSNNRAEPLEILQSLKADYTKFHDLQRARKRDPMLDHVLQKVEEEQT